MHVLDGMQVRPSLIGSDKLPTPPPRENVGSSAGGFGISQSFGLARLSSGRHPTRGHPIPLPLWMNPLARPVHRHGGRVGDSRSRWLTGSALVWITAASSGGCVAANFIQPDVEKHAADATIFSVAAGPRSHVPVSRSHACMSAHHAS
ncbi:hypothetical protein V2G26_015431 [Clonostachys chloroleuca]